MRIRSPLRALVAACGDAMAMTKTVGSGVFMID